ncbi:MAG: OB-fold domain-containing protein [Acidimicrobiales bacterium]
MTTTERVPAIEGWFTTSEPYTLIGAKCARCGTFVFPPRGGTCPSPDCEGSELEPTPLSRRGTVWSYTENHYAPPPPFKAADPFEPYALAAVQLEAEGLVILGQVAKGVMAADLKIGMPVEVDLQVLYQDDEGVDHWVWTWAPVASKGDA